MKIFSTAYFPNIEYISNLIYEKKIQIEQYENFPKQTYRNRCHILAANGIIPLTVPVLKGRSGKIMTKDIKISYVEDWQKQHFQTIKSAYSASPFYEYYMPEIERFFQKKYEYLIDFNIDILKEICELLSIDLEIDLTTDFVPILQENEFDYRFLISPKVESQFKPEKYIQVFSDRYEFQSNLSILDLLFNLGTDSRIYLIRVCL